MCVLSGFLTPLGFIFFPIFIEREKLLQNKRLDLDAAKTRLKKASY